MSDNGEKRTPEVESGGRPRVDPRLLEILVCPVTRAELTYDPVRQELGSRAARLAYPIREGVPIMWPEEAPNRAAGAPFFPSPPGRRGPCKAWPEEGVGRVDGVLGARN